MFSWNNFAGIAENFRDLLKAIAFCTNNMRAETAKRNPPEEVTGVWPFGLPSVTVTGYRWPGGVRGFRTGFKTDFSCDFQ